MAYNLPQYYQNPYSPQIANINQSYNQINQRAPFFTTRLPPVNYTQYQDKYQSIGNTSAQLAEISSSRMDSEVSKMIGNAKFENFVNPPIFQMMLNDKLIKKQNLFNRKALNEKQQRGISSSSSSLEDQEQSYLREFAADIKTKQDKIIEMMNQMKLRKKRLPQNDEEVTIPNIKKYKKKQQLQEQNLSLQVEEEDQKQSDIPMNFHTKMKKKKLREEIEQALVRKQIELLNQEEREKQLYQKKQLYLKKQREKRRNLLNCRLTPID